ncbi:lectin BRA-3-like [Amphibalanus amphitrite]|uniref:lectin BRA-3-like n=1 Tax=Amphibalanus amphitrite TaxID=1232801 RepID=UPI001C908669|nr:lectin BRA-3-like [Amphibalanus amphitrite]
MLGPNTWIVVFLATRAALGCPNSQWLATGDDDCFLPLPPSMANVTADDALEICHDIEPTSSLPEILDDEDQQMVHELSGGSNIWLGLRRSSSTSAWVWPSGKAAIFTKWANEQPVQGDENCVYMNFAQGAWYNSYCNSGSDTNIALCYVKWKEEVEKQ